MDSQFFAALSKTATAGIATTFERVIRKRPSEHICGFCIYSDDDAQSLCTISCTREGLQDPRNFFYTSGWPYDYDEIQCLSEAQNEQSKSYEEYKRRYEGLYESNRNEYWPLWEQYRLGVFETLVTA